MLALFREDLARAMEREDEEGDGLEGAGAGAAKGAAQMLMLDLMQGLDLLSQLEKEVVVEALT